MKESTKNIIMKAVCNYETSYKDLTWLRCTYETDLAFLEVLQETFKGFTIKDMENLLGYYKVVLESVNAAISENQIKEISDIILILEGQVL